MGLKDAVFRYIERDNQRDAEQDVLADGKGQVGQHVGRSAEFCEIKRDEISTTHAASRNSEVDSLIRWFLGSLPPPDPFELRHGVTVLRPHHFWAHLRMRIHADPYNARAFVTAHQHLFRRLDQIFGDGAISLEDRSSDG